MSFYCWKLVAFDGLRSPQVDVGNHPNVNLLLVESFYSEEYIFRVDIVIFILYF
jgi:hypothetical protein